MVQLHPLQPVVAAVQAVEAGREQQLRPHPPRQPVVGQGQPGQAGPRLVLAPAQAARQQLGGHNLTSPDLEKKRHGNKLLPKTDNNTVRSLIYPCMDVVLHNKSGREEASLSRA
jgi:hypothetical protein